MSAARPGRRAPADGRATARTTAEAGTTPELHTENDGEGTR